MEAVIKSVVTFKSFAFNTTEPKEYFINPCCFGDDVAKWLAAQLRSKGYQAAEEPGHEDFGWYFGFSVNDIQHCLVIGYREEDNGQGIWVGWVERSRGLMASIFGRRKHGIEGAAAQAIHEVLANDPKIQSIHWHFENDFNSGREESGTPEPS